MLPLAKMVNQIKRKHFLTLASECRQLRPEEFVVARARFALWCGGAKVGIASKHRTRIKSGRIEPASGSSMRAAFVVPKEEQVT